MNHEAIASSLCGRYTQLSDTSGYLESIFHARGDGSLLGAYIVSQRGDNLIVTDDGDTLFNALSNGTDATYSRTKSYRHAVEINGARLSDDGEITLETSVPQLSAALARYFRATMAVSDLAYKHRPSDSERFMRTVGEDLARYGKRLSARPTMTGLSGHQLAFHFGIDVAKDSAIMIQTIAASNGALKWGDVYEAGGKFKDAKSARSKLRLVAVLEDGADADKASSFLSDIADVHIYRGQPLAIAA